MFSLFFKQRLLTNKYEIAVTYFPPVPTSPPFLTAEVVSVFYILACNSSSFHSVK